MGFTVDIVFTEAAETALARTGEGVIVWANYYGSPTKAVAHRADQVGRIQLDNDRIVLGEMAAAPALNSGAR